eukprot:429601_1
MVVILWYQLFVFLQICVSEYSMPVIGVIAQPCDTFGVDLCKQSGFTNATSYLPAKYVKWIEMGGSQVIPLFPYKYEYSELVDLISKLNGIFIVGGAGATQPRSKYEKFIADILNILRQYRDNNYPQNIPLWGTCDGFENILTAVAKTGESVMDQYSASNVNLNISFTDNINDSVMFNLQNEKSQYYELNRLMIDLMTEYSITYNDHHKGILPNTFVTDEYVNSNFSNLGISYDKNGKAFVALFESRKELNLNWFAVQFHPENPSFRVQKDVNRSYNAIIVNSWFAQFFVNVVKESNNNQMTNDEFEQKAIYNYDPIHQVDEIYVFN